MIHLHSSTYEQAKISGSDVANKRQSLAYFHTAIFERSSNVKVLASCVTFASRERVPPGSVYNVSGFWAVILGVSNLNHISDRATSECHRDGPRPDLHIQRKPGSILDISLVLRVTDWESKGKILSDVRTKWGGGVRKHLQGNQRFGRRVELFPYEDQVAIPR